MQGIEVFYQTVRQNSRNNNSDMQMKANLSKFVRKQFLPISYCNYTKMSNDDWKLVLGMSNATNKVSFGGAGMLQVWYKCPNECAENAPFLQKMIKIGANLHMEDISLGINRITSFKNICKGCITFILVKIILKLWLLYAN